MIVSAEATKGFSEAGVLFLFSETTIEKARDFCRVLLDVFPADRLTGITYFFFTALKNPGLGIHMTFAFNDELSMKDATEFMISALAKYDGRLIKADKLHETLEIFKKADIQATGQVDVNTLFDMAAARVEANRAAKPAPPPG